MYPKTIYTNRNPVQLYCISKFLLFPYKFDDFDINFHPSKAGSSEGGESESFDPTSFYKQQQAEMMMQVRDTY